MCGIVGFVEKKSSSKAPSVYKKMLEGIKHRGPDGEGTWTHSNEGWNIFLGHQRLAIIDIEGGAQPFGKNFSEKIVFNGEIFNFLDLKKKIESDAAFSTRSDTEVLFHWLRQKKPLQNLNGMFAFAFWDETKQSLLLARDPAGIKPLYYASLPEGGIAFASELKSLLAHPEISKEFNNEAIREYFFLDYFRAPQTLFRNIFKLLPGHSLLWEKGRLHEATPYFEIAKLFQNSLSAFSIEDTQAFIEMKLNQAVERQLVADVPVGVFLSGGLDSSLIASLAAAKTTRKIKTFSIGFRDKDFDETPYSNEVSHFLKTEHHHQYFEEADLLKEFDAILRTLDEPLADPSYLPTFILSRLAAKEVKVTLGGDGGDELWAGYPTYFAHAWAKPLHFVPAPILKGLRGLFSQLKVNSNHQSLEWKLKRFFNRFETQPVHRHLHWMSGTEQKNIKYIFNHTLSSILFESLEKKLQGIPPDQIYLALDFISYLPGSVLTKVDRASMANGLEVRPPFLDHEFVAASFQVPYALKYRGRENKWLLKKIAHGKIPDTILKRKKKGFGIPLARWLRGPLKEEISFLLGDRVFLESIGASQPALQKLWNEFVDSKYDASKTFWSLLVLKKVLLSF